MSSLTNKQTKKLKTKEFEEKTEFIVRISGREKKGRCIGNLPSGWKSQKRVNGLGFFQILEIN